MATIFQSDGTSLTPFSVTQGAGGTVSVQANQIRTTHTYGSGAVETGFRSEQSGQSARYDEFKLTIDAAMVVYGASNLFHSWTDNYAADFLRIELAPSGSGYVLYTRDMSTQNTSGNSAVLSKGTQYTIGLEVTDAQIRLYVNGVLSTTLAGTFTSKFIGVREWGAFYTDGINGSQYFDDILIATSKPVALGVAPTTDLGKLQDVYAGWKQFYIQSNGRVRREDGSTVSEGQGYNLQFAIQFLDQANFDLSETYNRNVLERRNAGTGALTNPGGLYLMAGAANATGVTNWDWASDADVDRMQALDVAQTLVDTGAWPDSFMNYGQRRDLIRDNLIAVAFKTFGTNTKKAYLLPESYQLTRNPFVLNPSYFDPATWRDVGTPDMYRYIQGSYDLLTRIQSSVGLWPDWFGATVPADTLNRPFTNLDGYTYSDRFSYDAFRTVFRLYREVYLNANKQALVLLEKYAAFMQTEYNSKGYICAEYNYDGSVYGNYEKSAMTYAAYLAFMATGRTTLAQTLYDAKLSGLYVQDANGSYYRDNPTTSGQYQGVREYFMLAWIIFSELLRQGVWKDARKVYAITRTRKAGKTQAAQLRVRVGGVTQRGMTRVYKNGRWTN